MEEFKLVVIDGVEIPEIWKPIKGYESFYQVSNYGRIRSLDREIPFIQRNQFGEFPTIKRVKGKLLRHKRAGDGYYNVCLHDGETKKYRYIHRLVAEHFIGDCEGLEINHKSGVKSCNCVWNLEIATRQENQNHAYDAGLNKLFNKSRPIRVNGVVYQSIGEASKATGYNKNLIHSRLKNPNPKMSGNFKHNVVAEYV